MKSILPFCSLAIVLASCAAAPQPRPLYSYGSDATAASFGAPSGYASSALEAEAQNYPPPPVPQSSRSTRARQEWNVNRSALQGFFGVAEYGDIQREDGSVSVEVDDAEFPVIGGGAQVKMGGANIDIGLEGMFDFGWRSDAAAVAIGGGGAAVAVDVDMLVFELFGGPFVSKFLGEKLRVYGAAGPLLQFATYDESNSIYSDDGSGFGYGYYARAGAEVRLGAGMLLGFGMRWSDSQIDLGGAGDLEVDGIQWLLTVTRGI